MSRRARVEAEKAIQLANEIHEEEDKLKMQMERIYAPLVWRRLENGVRIQDLKPCYFEEVLKMIEEYYLPEDVVTKNTKITEDHISVQSFLHKVFFAMKDLTSLIAINENKDEDIVGVQIFKVVNKFDYGRVFSRVQLVEGEAHQNYVDFMSNLNRKVDIFEQMKCESFLRFYITCVKPEYRRKGFGAHFFDIGLEVARTLCVPVVMGCFSSFFIQKLAKRLGMQVLHEINYVDYVDMHGDLIFCDPGAGNYSCALMAGVVPPPPKPEPPPPKPKSSKEKKMTRAEKRKAKKGNKK